MMNKLLFFLFLFHFIAKKKFNLSILRLNEVDMAGYKLWFDVNSHPIKIDLVG